MTDNVFSFPRRLPPERGDLWRAVKGALDGSKRAQKPTALARKLGASPELVLQTLMQLTNAGHAYINDDDGQSRGGAA